MYPYLRLALVLWRARSKPALGLDDAGVLRLTAYPWDCDVYPEVNNGRQLTLFDLGRFEFGARVGLFQVLRARKWGLVVGGSSVRYRRRIRPFQRFMLETRFVGRDERWIYAVQTTFVGDVACSQALLRVAVAAGEIGVVPTQEVAAALGAPDWNPPLPEWARAWVEAEERRPWPPAGPAAPAQAAP